MSKKYGKFEAYRFTFNGSTVTSLAEVKGGFVQPKWIKPNETWTYDGNQVIKTEWKNGRQEVTIFADPDGDGLFTKVGKGDGGGVGATLPGAGSSATGQMPVGEWGYRFTITNQQVTGVTEVTPWGGQVPKWIKPTEQWQAAADHVVKSEAKWGAVEIDWYRDSNGDGIYQETLALTVNNGQNPWLIETFRFPSLAANQQKVTINGSDWIVSTFPSASGQVGFALYRDDDHDGQWTQIAQGWSKGEFVTDGNVDLVGMIQSGLLDAAATLVG